VAPSINDIGNGSSGSFDYERSIEEQDTRKLSTGGKGSAPADPRIGTTIVPSAVRNRQRAFEAGLGPNPSLGAKKAQVAKLKKGKLKQSPISDALVESIRFSESSQYDRKNKTMTTYIEAATATKPETYNIGPGLNLDSPLVKNALKVRGFDAHKLKSVFNFSQKEVIPDGLVPLMNDVFKDVVKASRRDAITYVGGMATWKKLKKNEQDALIDMSYNMGLPTHTKAAIINLTKNRSPQALKAVLNGMRDSDWYRGRGGNVNQRALKIMDLFSQKQDEESQRFATWVVQNNSSFV
jgi:hypothetical protein